MNTSEMKSHEKKHIAVRFFEAQDRLKGGPDDALCAPTYTSRIGSNPAMDLGGHKQFARAFYDAFPDLYHTIDDTVAEGDKVAVRFTLRGTHTHPLMDIPATGKRIEIGAIAILEIVQGQVVALNAHFDQVGMLQQLGVMPVPS